MIVQLFNFDYKIKTFFLQKNIYTVSPIWSLDQLLSNRSSHIHGSKFTWFLLKWLKFDPSIYTE